MSEPLPKELVMEAWKASVGYSLERVRTQDACVGIRRDSKRLENGHECKFGETYKNV